MKYKNISSIESIQLEEAISAADALYDAVNKSYPNRALFFLKIDELYLNLCVGSTSKSASYFTQIAKKKLQLCFSKLVWTDSLYSLADQYQRNCRKWIWPLFNGQILNSPEYLEEIEAILKIHQSLLKGISLSEIEHAGNCYIRTELRYEFGANDSVKSEFLDQLAQSDFDNKLKSLCLINEKRDKRGDIGRPLQMAQDSLMWMGIVSFSPQNTERSPEIIQKLVKSLWSNVMDEHMTDYDICFLAKQCTRRISENRRMPYGLIHYPYGQILDVSVKANAQILFCTVYTISCIKEERIDSHKVLNNTMELFYSTFAGNSQIQNIQTPVSNIIKGYLSSNKSGVIDKEVVKYFQGHYDFAEECFERLQKLHEDDISRVESEIVSKKTRAAEDIALMYQEREDEALGHLMETLSNPIYGNVIGQLYRIAKEQTTNLTMDEICHLLNNLFLLMQQKRITPIDNSNNLYPGWNISGKTFVKPVEREVDE